jgi:hypothetical protein
MTATANAITIVDVDGRLDDDLNLDLATTTPSEVIDHLKEEQRIFAVDPVNPNEQLVYSIALNDKVLAADKPLAHQGVKPGSTLTLLSQNVKG